MRASWLQSLSLVYAVESFLQPLIVQRAPPLCSTAEQEIIFQSHEADEELLERGRCEAQWMSRHQSTLKPNKAKGVGGGFGAEKNLSKDRLTAEATSHALVLREQGIVRIDKVLTARLADNLHRYVVDLRARASEDVRNGVLELGDRFADKLHNTNRCDLKLCLGPDPVNDAIRHILTKTPIWSLMQEMFGQDGKQASLYELNCFMSNSGSRRQLVHPDCSAEHPLGLSQDEPVMLTAFVALQDVELDMGPTCWIPGSHNQIEHEAFFTNKEAYLSSRKNVLGVLPKGACAVFDPRTLHCATANQCPDPTKTRALFYMSFKNPRVLHPGAPSTSGYGIGQAEITMQELHDGQVKGDASAKQRLGAITFFP